MDNSFNNPNNQFAGNQTIQPSQMPNINPGYMPPAKPPMDPAKKKKLIMIILLIVGGVIVIAAAIIIFIIMSKIDYSTSYQSAKDLNSVIYSLQSNNCTNITEDVDSEYTSDNSYNSYIAACSTVIQDINKYSNELRETDAVKKNKEIKEQFERYWELKESTVPSDDDFAAKTKIYSAWHSFSYNADKASAKTASDADLQHIASFLIDSGNDRLKTYGEGWLEKTTAYVHAYQAYYNAKYSDPNYSQLRQTRDDLQSEREVWITANRPNITDLANLDFSKSKQLTSEFSKLYDLIKENYEQNYNSNSDDCFELFGEVICD